MGSAPESSISAQTAPEPAALEQVAASLAATDQQIAASIPYSTLGVGSPVPTASVAAQAAPVALSAPVTPISVMTGLVSSLLAWVGLGPSLTSTPVAPAESPGLLGLLAWARRQIQQTLLNQTPTTNYNPTQNSQSVEGVVTGNLNAVDADGDQLTFTVTGAPQHGTVVINPDGTFTYTPTTAFAHSGGTDSFTVKVNDDTGGFHLHLLSLLAPDGGHSTQVTVALTVTPVNDPPTVGDPSYTVGNVNPTTGVVTGSVHVTDPDGDTLTYSLSTPPDPNKGTVVVDAATGTWTYTPTLNARLKATDINAIPADQLVNFTITATDGVDSTGVSVTTTVAPLSITTIDVGQDPSDHAFTPDGKYAYVTSLRGFVRVIDTATNTVIATIPVGEDGGLWSVAISSDGSHAYITRGDPQALHVIDIATNTITATIPLSDYPSFPIAVAVSPDGSHAYVTIVNLDTEAGTFVVIDTATSSVTATIPVGYFPIGVAVSPDGGHVYVTNDDVVSAIDTASYMVTTIPVVGGVGYVAFSPDGTRAYVTNPDASTVSVIDTDSTSATYNTVTATIATPPGHAPWQLAVSPDGVHVYVTNEQADTMSVIDTTTNTVIATIAVGELPESVAVSPDGTMVYVVNHIDGTMSVISLA